MLGARQSREAESVGSLGGRQQRLPMAVRFRHCHEDFTSSLRMPKEAEKVA